MTKRNAKKNAAPTIELQAIEMLPTEAPQGWTEAGGPVDIDILGDDILDLIPDADPVVEAAAPSESDIESAVAVIEAHEEQVPQGEVQADQAQASADEQVEEVPALDDVMAEITREEAQAMQTRVIASLDARVAFEKAKHGEGHNILKTISKARAKLAVSFDPSRVLIAASVDPEFMNRELSDGNRYNVYAIDKVQDFLNFLGGAKGELTNAINIACMKSLFAFKKAGVAFTLETAKGAASLDYARSLDASVKKLLISHTVAKTTAPTQSSSTMQALVTLGVVNAIGSRKNPTYELTNSPLTKQLELAYAA